ncbi:MAG: hypothetical protein A3F68_09885 [Acidobacteria bacterium RIFCSPLOWO2_12_FULL_54_10]|nr:MAG: hypothetical protein A3F68_09885 [Acidobacteria bacterium RIFCSPLOWO2_12_FULL_54_10]
MVFYRRRLPHWHPHEKSFFVIWRLYGSLPKQDCTELKRIQLKRKTARVLKEQVGSLPEPLQFPDEAFFAFDRRLNQASDGPLWLRDPRLAEMLVDALRQGENNLELYSLWAYVVMPNHVHVLLTPRVPLEKITRVLKGYSAREANRILERVGRRFWQTESYDHWIRSEESFSRIVRYIEWNPVSAGLVRRPEDWPWSSAWSGARS